MSEIPAIVRTALERPGLRGLLLGAWRKFSADRAARMGAAIAYYAVFAVAPLVLVAVGVAGLVLSEEAAQGEVVGRLADAVGTQTAVFVEGLIADAGGGAGVGGTIVGSVLAVFAASAVAVQLKGALDTVNDVPADTRMGLPAALRARAKGLAVVLGAGAILLGVMAASAAIAALEEIAGSRTLGLVLDYLDPVIGVVFGALAFTVMFSFLPARRVPFREAAVGGITAALLFTAATLGLSRYLGSGAIGRGFGAAAALVVLLVFVYYSAQIVLFGAEVARVWGLRRGSGDAIASSPRVEARTPPAPGWTVAAFVLGILIGRRRR
ncbi:MAG TPA: YhjD/YihY/BrkB family envelope integrity protein [Acidimicrobiia bacterium]|nr:YhjD/YihY/BrkB family envelope integrity protein [Acidimicrobiia bacterium]